MPCKGLNWGTSNPQWVSVPTHPRRMAEIITNASVKQNQNKQTQTLKVKWKCACELAQEDIPGPGSGTLMTSPSCKLRPGSVLLVSLEKEAGIFSGIFLRIDHHMKARTINSLPITTQRFGLMSRFTEPLKLDVATTMSPRAELGTPRCSTQGKADISPFCTFLLTAIKLNPCLSLGVNPRSDRCNKHEDFTWKNPMMFEKTAREKTEQCQHRTQMLIKAIWIKGYKWPLKNYYYEVLCWNKHRANAAWCVPECGRSYRGYWKHRKIHIPKINRHCHKSTWSSTFVYTVLSKHHY